MKKMNVSKITRMFGRMGLKLKKHSPEILVAAGIVGGVTSAVMACKATTKAGAIVDEMQSELEKIHKVAAMPGIDYTEMDLKKDTAIVYAQTAMKYIKLYGPSVVLGTASITSILTGHNLLRKRNVALAAAYATIDRGFKEYRDRVIERFGKEIDKELKYNIRAREVEEIVTDENGNETVVKTSVGVPEIDKYSSYARAFDDGNIGWNPDPELSLMFLLRQQDWANERLRSWGHLYLNEVYDMLGIPRSKAGSHVGWIYDENAINDDESNCDGYVDFGIYDIRNERKRAFVNGLEKCIWLDFNVDGIIDDKVEQLEMARIQRSKCKLDK